MRARRVRGIEVGGPLADNVERIVQLRLEELHGFIPAALDPDEVEALHDMRIAAKRLRYVLEVTAEECFGPYAAIAARRAKDLQDLIGEIHDCDVGLPRVTRAIDERREADVTALLERAGDDALDLDPRLAADLPHASEHRGLLSLHAYLQARRRLLYGRFLELWRELEREGFRARLEYAIAERPAITSPSPDGNVAVTPRP
ncbi:CHAD domain-containing protein [Patulibacter defluvii]|uniref:CHAD domain-containing protein n=1 Tax=Patulibacter defluvii TaxID=3095358 RepID=UPI0035C90949